MKSMIFAVLIHLCCLITLGQQRSIERKPLRLVEVPRDEVVIGIVSQPRCPLRIEEASFLRRLDNGKAVQRFKVRNVSSRPIATFTVNSWSITGSGGTLPVILTGKERLLQGGELLDSLEDVKDEILPFSEAIREKLRREHDVQIVGKMQNVFFLSIDMVRFADGSVYVDKTVTEALGGYLSDHYRYQ